MANARQYLEWHGQQWRVRIKVPAKLRDLIGRGKLTVPLHTADLKLANDRKWPIVSRLKAIIAAADQALTSQDPIEAEALQHRLHKEDEGTQYAVHERAVQIVATKGHAVAKAFYDLASGRVTPLSHHADAFVQHRGYRMKSEGDFRRALGWLSDWLRDSHLPVAIEAVTRQAAWGFISESLTVGRSGKKAAAYLGFIRQYWLWLLEKGYVTENPWVGQSLPAPSRSRRDAEQDGGKRPFTDTEIRTLLSGTAGPMLDDVMRIAALSGMRLEEICQLQVGDCTDGEFFVWAGKTDNARRRVPIHSGLASIVKRRTAGRAKEDFLIDGLPPVGPSRETRSDPAAKRFVRYRRSHGVDERPNGKMKSNVDFHSFRRWFIRSARNAMQEGRREFDEWTLLAVIGHTKSERPKSLDLAMRGYAGPDPEKAKRRLVESVTLPDGTQSDRLR
ncbi:DUF6538 domain-containing protein [Mesorhizobium sp. Z1-4]|uniref:DUF6538 domain-containing protein n=1 Tax=Mesorhizobium sp. Z1-4 TaxID=2448478 RepID=UPI000FDB3D8C|nr:DUF6538 domain-containing protein [Mesorhizobium sp. Z1-4]